MEDIKIKRIVEINEMIVEGVNSLLGQLVSDKQIFTESDLYRIITSESSMLFLMYLNDNVIGMFTIGNYYSPTGRKFWLEDVVIDSKYRGKSLGKRMLTKALEIVSTFGTSTLMLTSKPVRIAANNLYISLGFSKKDTNVYRMDFVE